MAKYPNFKSLDSHDLLAPITIVNHLALAICLPGNQFVTKLVANFTVLRSHISMLFLNKFSMNFSSLFHCSVINVRFAVVKQL